MIHRFECYKAKLLFTQLQLMWREKSISNVEIVGISWIKQTLLFFPWPVFCNSVNKNKLKISQNSDGTISEPDSALESSRYQPHLADWHSTEQHKTLKCYEDSFTPHQNRSCHYLYPSFHPQIPSVHMAAAHSHPMTETRSVRTQKPTTKMELATEELKLSLGVISERFIFSFSYTGGLCSSPGFYQNGTLKSRHVEHTWIVQEALLEAFREQDGMQKYTEHTNVPLEGKTLSNWHQ